MTSRTFALKGVEVAALIAVLLIYGYFQITFASSVDDYISDEIWYVSSARNYLNKVFGVYPSVGSDMYRVTLELVATSRSDFVDTALRLQDEISGLGGRVVKSTDYYGTGDNPLYAVCADVPKEALKTVTSFPYVRSFGVGYCYPNAGNILNYMNFEHPPLGKYMVALSILTCGDRPLCWRLPSIASGVGILILEYVLLKRVLEGSWGSVLAVVVPAITALDKTFRSLTVVAMLDAPLALLTYAACFYAASGSVYKSTTSLSLAFSTKFSGGFVVPALYSRYTRKVPPAMAILLLVYAPLAMFIALSAPLLAYKGDFFRWWAEAVEGAVRWHISTKVEPGKGPPAAAPWDWLVGANSFILHYKYVEGAGFVADLVASGNPILYLGTAAISIYLLPKLRKMPDEGFTWLCTWLTWAMYVLLWLAGNKSQYSFYMVQLVPLLYTLLGIAAYYLSDMENLIEVSRAWLKLLKSLSRYLRGEARLKIQVQIEDTGKQ
jgi:predicted membrane-bound dolichyl-phosphate-mannose-protein mannosyltransferase